MNTLDSLPFDSITLPPWYDAPDCHDTELRDRLNFDAWEWIQNISFGLSEGPPSAQITLSRIRDAAVEIWGFNPLQED